MAGNIVVVTVHEGGNGQRIAMGVGIVLDGFTLLQKPFPDFVLCPADFAFFLAGWQGKLGDPALFSFIEKDRSLTFRTPTSDHLTPAFKSYPKRAVINGELAN